MNYCEIVIRRTGVEAWAWYIKQREGHEGSAYKTVASCKTYYSRADVAWRHAMNALEDILLGDHDGS